MICLTITISGKMAVSNRTNAINDVSWSMEKKIWKINFIWSASVAAVVIAGISALCLCRVSGDSLISLLTNFATVLSIILSISSIAYSYSTSHDTARQFAEIDKMVAQMRENNEEIRKNILEISRDVHYSNSAIDNTRDLGNANLKSNLPEIDATSN